MAVRWLRCAILLIGLVALLGIGQIEVRAQGIDDIDALGTQVSQLYGQGKYAEAIPIAERYVTLARQQHGEEHPEFATALSWLAHVYHAQGRYAEAEPLAKRALAIGEKALGPDHPDVGTSLNNLAGLYRDQGRYAEAEPLYRRSLTLSEKILGADHPRVGTSLSNLLCCALTKRCYYSSTRRK